MWKSSYNIICQNWLDQKLLLHLNSFWLKLVAISSQISVECSVSFIWISFFQSLVYKIYERKTLHSIKGRPQVFIGHFIYLSDGKVQCQVMHVFVIVKVLSLKSERKIVVKKVLYKNMLIIRHHTLIQLYCRPALFCSAKNTIPEDAFTLENTM